MRMQRSRVMTRQHLVRSCLISKKSRGSDTLQTRVRSTANGGSRISEPMGLSSRSRSSQAIQTPSMHASCASNNTERSHSDPFLDQTIAELEESRDESRDESRVHDKPSRSGLTQLMSAEANTVVTNFDCRKVNIGSRYITTERTFISIMCNPVTYGLR